MFVLVFAALLACVSANYPAAYPGLTVIGPSYHHDPVIAKAIPVPVAQPVPVAVVKEEHVAVAPNIAYSEHYKAGGIQHTLTNVNTATGAVKQQTAVGKDALGNHVIRHSAQATNVDPHSGQSDVQHDEHEFHINPYLGSAAVHTNNAEGSLNPSVGAAVFAQKTHEAKIAPGHASVADVKDTAQVTAFSSAASRDVNAARTDVAHDGIAKQAHASHKSYANAPGIGGHAKAAETNHQSFDGPGYGSLHYDSQSADEAYDAHGHKAANEQGYKLDQAYDARLNLGASNELQYSRHAAHDPQGNYGSVTQTKESSHGGQLVPVVHNQPALVVQEQPAVAVSHAAPVVYSEPVGYQKQDVYSHSEPAVAEVYGEPHLVGAYAKPVPVAYQKQALVYSEPAPVAYQKKQALVYSEPAPVIYPKKSAYVYEEPLPVAYQKHSALYYEPRAVYKQPVSYGKSHYSNNGYYRHGY